MESAFLLVGVALGYLLGRLDLFYRGAASSAPPSFFRQAARSRDNDDAVDRVARVSIDERKVVTDIKTDNIKKVTALELGSKTVQQDTINQSVSKLAQLKGR
jgi:hypothetical protein